MFYDSQCMPTYSTKDVGRSVKPLFKTGGERYPESAPYTLVAEEQTR